jgi:hypothetical protein
MSVLQTRKIALSLLVALAALFCIVGGGVAAAAQVTLAWDANSDQTVTGYRVYYRTGAAGPPYDGAGLIEGDSPVDVPLSALEDSQNPMFTLSGLSSGTYYFVCTAYDAYGNESGYSNEVSFDVTAATDEDPPAAPSGIEAMTLDANRVLLSWSPTADTGGSGLAGYRIFRDGEMAGTTTETVFMDSGLLAATAYTYTLEAFDLAGNTSPRSAELTAQTLMESDLSLRINCGGGSYLDSAGHQWSADTGYTGGFVSGTSDAIHHTEDDMMVRTVRYEDTPENTLPYTFSVPSGTYQVNLYFADIYDGTAGIGKRIFDVAIEDQVYIDNLDIYALVGHDTALIYSFETIVSDGEITIALLSEYKSAVISGIEILSKGYAAPSQYTLTATAGANGSISPAGATSVTAGGGLTYTIAPAAHYHVSNVNVDNAPVGAVTSYRFDNVSADHTIHAEFAIDTYTVSTDAGSGGTISPSGTVTVAHGESLTFQVTPNAHHEIADVQVNGVSVGAVSSYTLTNIEGNTTCTASFVADTHTVTATAGASGAISPAGVTEVNCGDSVTYTITPDAHHHVDDVLVNGQSVGAVSTYTFSKVTADATIEARFAVDTYTISAQAGEHGQIAPAGESTVAHGESLAYTITPEDGYRVADVVVDGQSQGAIDQFSFTNVTGPHTIQVSFVTENLAPVADAGPDQEVDEGQLVTLSAANSVDPDDGIAAFQWEQVSGPLVELNGADTESPFFTAPDVDINGVSLTFRVTAQDYAGLEDSDTAIVNVTWVNTPPVAATGPNQTVLEGEDVLLDGSNSSDSDDGIASYLWQQTAGTPVALNDAHSAQPGFVAPDVDLQGEALSFELTVTDQGGLQATATCVINVSWVNVSPVADAGPDQSVIEGALVTLDGSNSVDTDNGIATYHWNQLEGVPVQFSDPNAVQPQFTAPDVGVQGGRLVFQLTVTDAGGLQDQATCIVNVIGQNQPPVAHAGADQQVGEGLQVILDASGSSDADDGIAAYQWRQVSGPVVTLSDAGAVQPSFTTPDVGPEGASLVFRLTISDHSGLQSEDDCIVTVTWENQPPLATAGADQTVTEGALVTLDGSGSSDSDDGISAYLWSQVSGRAVTLTDPTAVSPAFTVPADAVDGEQLTFRLTVTDGGGLQDDAHCTVTVLRSHSEDTLAPEVMIGTPTSKGVYSTEADQLDLSGSAADASGIVEVTWQTNHGHSGSAAGTTDWKITGVPLAVGDTLIQITAVDGAGNSGVASLSVTRKAVVDTQAPELTLLAPTTGDFLFTKRSYLSLSGTASDNDKVSKVTWAHPNGTSGTADGTETWSISRISLKKWFNTIVLTAVDPAGNTTTKTLTVLRWGW